MTLQPSERKQLRQFLTDRFNLDELKNLAFDLGVDFEKLSHKDKEILSRELITFFEHRNKLDLLVTEVLRQRPDDFLIQIKAKLPPSNTPLKKIQIIVAQDLLDDISELKDEIAARLNIPQDEVVLISAAWGSIRLLISLSEQFATSLISLQIHNLLEDKYQVISITDFDSLDDISQRTWRYVSLNQPPVWQGELLRPTVFWKDAVEETTESLSPINIPSKRLHSDSFTLGKPIMNDFGGVLCVDKPLGITSHDVVNRVRRVAGLRRVGHAGTLDPLATGVLLLCLGRTTRLIEYLVGHDKVYETTVRLGQTTASYDAEGDIVDERPFTHLTLSQLQDALEPFRGDILQQPPIYSAIKQGGQPLYKLARQGKTDVALPFRPVTIHELTLLNWEPPFLSLRIHCSSGTYIRSLGHDLGEALGCGGHLTALRRLAVGDFTVDTAVPLDKLTPENMASYLLSPDTAVRHLPRIDLLETAAADILQGKPLPKTDKPMAELARAYGPGGQFLGVIIAKNDQWLARKMFPAIT